jgi:hypothetical protein
MAIVRRASRQASTAPLPGARRTAAATAISEGAGVAQARADRARTIGAVGAQIGRIGATLYEQIQAEEKEKADQTALLKASNRISTWKNQRFLDPNEGAFTKKGEAAQPLPEQLRSEYQQLVSEVTHDLTPDQQRAFEKVQSQEWQQIDLQVRRHVFEQMQTFKAGELKTAIDNHVASAQANYADPKLVGLDMQKAIDALRVNGPQMGMGPEQLEAAEREIRSKTHVGVVNNLLANEKEKAAEIYFDAVKGQIDGDVLDDVQRAIAAGSDKRQAQDAFDEILAGGGTFKAMREKARGLEDTDVRDMVEAYLDREEARVDRETRTAHADLLRGAYDAVDQRGLRGIPPSTWSNLDGDERRSLQIYAIARAEGVPIKTDQAVFYRYMRMAADDPGTFVKANVLGDKHRLSDSDFQQLAGLQVSIANGDRVAAGKLLDDYRTENQVIAAALTSAGIDPSPSMDKEPERAAAVARLQRMVADRAQSLQTLTGKKATNKDVQGIVDDILGQTVETPGSWWALWQNAGKKRVVEMAFEDIPDADVEKVRTFLKAQGVPDTDDNILAYYIDARSRLRGR